MRRPGEPVFPRRCLGRVVGKNRRARWPRVSNPERGGGEQLAGTIALNVYYVNRHYLEIAGVPACHRQGHRGRRGLAWRLKLRQAGGYLAVAPAELRPTGETAGPKPRRY
jgi:hypothetical protein